MLGLIFNLAGPGKVKGVTYEIDDPVQFAQIIDTNAVHTTNATINGPAGTPLEGPVWIPSGGYLVFSDLVNNKLHKLVLPNSLSDFYDPPANTLCNGNMLDAQERLISCESGGAACGWSSLLTARRHRW